MKKVTVTIGIPAHNEEANIGNLLTSILKQKQKSFVIKKIYIVCDGCTDFTEFEAKKIALRNHNIEILNDGKRKGKAARLNTIYELAKTDYILTLDADTMLDTNLEIERMVKTMQSSKDIQVVGARFIPVKLNSFMGKLSIVSYKSFEDACWKLNNGNNFFTLVGAASLIRTSLAKTFTYPKNLVSDQNYLYVMATKQNQNGYKLAKNTRVLIRTVSTFHDWRVLGVRSTISDKQSVVSFFGNKILKEYYMPRKLFVLSTLKWFFKSPIYTTGSVLMNIYIRKFPYKQSTPRRGIWESTESSKFSIKE